MTKQRSFISGERIEKAILVLRDQKVMLDADLAALYGVETKALLQAVRRNPSRFPEDFAFQLTRQEFTALRSQIVTSKTIGRGGRRTLPIAFTEEGVAMLSSVLRSKRAVCVNVEIMRAFVRTRELLAAHREILTTNQELQRRLDDLEKRFDGQFAIVFEAIRALMKTPDKARREIGYHTVMDR